MTKLQTIGIIGAGKLGTALGRLVAKAGYDLLIHSRPNPMLRLVIPTVLPTAEVVEFDDMAERADVVILAVPRPATADLALDKVRGVIVDATNPWEATGTHTAVEAPMEKYPQQPVARALNHVAYEELVADSFPGDAPKRAMAVAGNGDTARESAAELVASFGFDPVQIPIDKQYLFDADGRLFGAWLSADDLRAQVDAS